MLTVRRIQDLKRYCNTKMEFGSRPDPAKNSDATAYLGYLDRAATYYLGRYATSVDNFRRILHRKLRRRGAYDSFDEAIIAGWIDEIVTKYIDLEILDDQTFATQKTRSLHSRGKSVRAIKGWLREKGISAEVTARALDLLREEYSDLDLRAAIQVAKRKRIGPFRRSGISRGETLDRDIRTKELAALARSGFSYAIARRVVDCPSEDELFLLLENTNELR